MLLSTKQAILLASHSIFKSIADEYEIQKILKFSHKKLKANS